MQESAVWVDETQSVLNQLGRRGNTSPLSGKEDEDPLGLSDEGSKAKSEEEMLEMFPECKFQVFVLKCLTHARSFLHITVQLLHCQLMIQPV